MASWIGISFLLNGSDFTRKAVQVSIPLSIQCLNHTVLINITFHDMEPIYRADISRSSKPIARLSAARGVQHKLLCCGPVTYNLAQEECRLQEKVSARVGKIVSLAGRCIQDRHFIVRLCNGADTRKHSAEVVCMCVCRSMGTCGRQTFLARRCMAWPATRV